VNQQSEERMTKKENYSGKAQMKYGLGCYFQFRPTRSRKTMDVPKFAHSLIFSFANCPNPQLIGIFHVRPLPF
jgi:hypothetical protein